jgi:hypothetical protein
MRTPISGREIDSKIQVALSSGYDKTLPAAHSARYVRLLSGLTLGKFPL